MITTDLRLAKDTLLKDQVISIPTETVYGLAGNAFSETAVEKIYHLKKRPFYNPLIVHIATAAFLPEIASDIPQPAQQLADTFWPGPLTLVLKKRPIIPNLVSSGKDTVAIRVPNHPLTLALLAELPFPLAAPSANPFGCISPTTAEHVAGYFGDELAVILDGGPCARGLESTIIGFEDSRPILYRHGALSVEDIEQCIGKLNQRTYSDDAPSAPGMLSRHYAPSTDTYFTDKVDEYLDRFSGQKIGLLLFKDRVNNDSVIHQEILSSSGNMEEAAQQLYAALHRLDNAGADVIIAERFPDKGMGKTINDRLQRAREK